MGTRVDKLEPYKSQYVVERSAYRLDHENKIVHLRMLSPDNGKTHVEYFSYIIARGIDVLTTKLENKLLYEMEGRMHKVLGNTWAMLKRKVEQNTKDYALLNEMTKKINSI